MSILPSFLTSNENEEGQEEAEGFLDMQYVVGNTTGLDVGQEPGPLPQRIGSTAQKGGEVLEVLLQNPATFQVDRQEMTNVIGQLGVDTTWHGDPNLGFGAGYATRAQGVEAGYNVVHRYFTRYLKQLASYKTEIRSHPQYSFDVGYVNMHASTEPIPPLEEQIASDKALDPFGEPVGEVKENKEPNIYRNKEFMKLLFDYMVLEYVEPLQLYNLFGEYSDWFQEEWRDAREDVTDQLYYDEIDDLRGKASIIETASGVDQGINIIYREKFDEKELDEPIIPSSREEVRKVLEQNAEDDESIDEKQVEQAYQDQKIESLQKANSLPDQLSPDNSESFRLKDVRRIATAVYQINNSEIFGDDGPLSEGDREIILDAVEDILEDIWTGNGDDNGLSFQAKASALTNRLDIQERDIADDADTDQIQQKAKKVFAGLEEGYDDPLNEDGEQKYLELFDRIIDRTRLGREIDKESTVFYNLLPAWLTVADQQYKNHPGFESAKFIWDVTVEDRYPDVDFDEYSEVKEKLDSDREFRLDITAAVASTYMWGHFTYKEDSFQTRGEEQIEGMSSTTWIRWMNRYGLKTNIEAMNGDPGNLLRLWRPKDIAVACRAINKTARRRVENWDSDWRGDPLKFTVDLEHTASFGVDPEEEMQTLIEQEKRLAEEGRIEADPEKPLSSILKTYHLTKPGFEQRGQHRHGPFMRGDTVLYRYLYNMIDAGFCRGDEEGIVMFEIGGEYAETLFTTRTAMKLIEMGVEPEELDPVEVSQDGDYDTQREELMAKFFGIDESSTSMEWKKIEEHAFDPLEGLLEAEEFDYTFSSAAAIRNDVSPRDYPDERYR